MLVWETGANKMRHKLKISAARMAGNGVITGEKMAGKELLNFADWNTLDLQGKRASSTACFQGLEDQDRGLNNPLATMDWEAEQKQTAWNQHLERNSLEHEPDYEPTEHIKNKKTTMGTQS